MRTTESQDEAVKMYLIYSVFNTYKIMGSQSEGCAICVFIHKHTHAHMHTQISKKLKCSFTVHILSYSIKELPLVTHKFPLRWENN